MNWRDYEQLGLTDNGKPGMIARGHFWLHTKCSYLLLSGPCKAKDQAKNLIESVNFKDNQTAKEGLLCWGQGCDWENLVSNACVVKIWRSQWNQSLLLLLLELLLIIIYSLCATINLPFFLPSLTFYHLVSFFFLHV